MTGFPFMDFSPNQQPSEKGQRKIQERVPALSQVSIYCCRVISNGMYSTRAADQCAWFYVFWHGVQNVDHGMHLESVRFADEHIQRHRAVASSPGCFSQQKNFRTVRCSSLQSTSTGLDGSQPNRYPGLCQREKMRYATYLAPMASRPCKISISEGLCRILLVRHSFIYHEE
jgi:hypothetical protein